MSRLLCATAFLLLLPIPVLGSGSLERETITTSVGDVDITFVGHGSLVITFGAKVWHIDPYSALADYSSLPKADVVLITHGHRDHLDPAALEQVRTRKSEVILTRLCSDKVQGGVVLNNGESHTVLGVRIEAVPAYNLVHKRENGQFFHPRGEGNGYVLTFGNTRIYIAGDTENTPEMKALSNIDYAFLPMNLPYTMTPEMVADAARAFKPKVLYPYHTGETDTARIVELMKDTPEVEVRIRQMK